MLFAGALCTEERDIAAAALFLPQDNGLNHCF
jgi:hypothetical protein